VMMIGCEKRNAATKGFIRGLSTAKKTTGHRTRGI